ncbi:trans-sialidase, putative, partial [Trypanosoma cruzi]
MLVVAVAVCSRCTAPSSPVPCVCVRELLLLGVAAVRMMVPLTVDGWRCLLSCPFLLSCFSLFLSLSYEERKQALLATVKLQGTERTNSTHTAHTHIYML